NKDSIIDVELDSTNTIVEVNEGNNSSLNNTFSAVASEPFYKLSNASLHRLQAIDMAIPSGLQSFDIIDDPTPLQSVLVRGAAGVVTSTNAIRIINGTVSSPNIQKDNYTDGNIYLNALSTFVTYANAQKPTKVITNLNQIEGNKINVFGTGTQTLNINTQPTTAQTNFVLLVNGNVTISVNPYNNIPNNSIAIIATGTITITNNVSLINAILIADTIQLTNPVTSTSTTPLKINGNLISNTAVTVTRDRATNPDLQPNLFVVFNPKMYLDLLPQLSDITVEGRQVE
ncbi:MAG TPA: hypothetical protein PLS49_06945, partial [Candidatus Woesebacteria bacterium]|nr:hypothetical protein [Candidatus Woesebacteria bacterium]